MAAYTTIDNPELYFQVKIYTGDGNDNRAITFDGDEDMQPNWLWFKNRGAAAWHNIYDSVRGANKALASNANNTEESRSDTLDSFDSNGFTVGNDTSQDPDGYNTNASSNTYVCWAWKESATAGFDIVSYTGNATARTISHSLSAVPHFIIIKNRDTSRSWLVGSKGLPSWSYHVYLDTTDDQNSDNNMFNGTTPTSSVFSLGNADEGNQNTDNMIGFLFSEKQGYSKFSKYIGNASDDGPCVFTGFRPAWIMCKAASDNGEGWQILDNKRDPNNPVLTKLAANAAGADSATAGDNNVDFLSNGFKIITNDNGLNKTGVTYIYAAFAEQPFVNSNGVPANAR